MLAPCSFCRRHIIVAALICPFCTGACARPKDTLDSGSRIAIQPAYGVPPIQPRVEPPGNDDLGPPVDVRVITGRGVATDEGVLAGLRPDFRACAKKAVSVDPKTSGTATITVQLYQNGDVEGMTSQTDLRPDELACIQKRLKKAVFDPSAADTLVVRVVHEPVTD